MSQRNNENTNQSCLNSTKISTNSNHSRPANDIYNQRLVSHLQTFDLNRNHVRQIAAPVQLNNYSNARYNQMHERRGDELNFTNSSTSSNHFNSQSEENER